MNKRGAVITLLALIICAVITYGDAWWDIGHLVISFLDLLIVLAIAGGRWVMENPRISLLIVTAMIIWSVVSTMTFGSVNRHRRDNGGKRVASNSTLIEYKRRENEQRGLD